MRETLEAYCMRTEWENLLAQWDTRSNLPLTPALISRGSKRKVWWRCEKGHVWQAAVYTRTGSGSGCPVCTGKVVQPGENDLAARFPKLMASDPKWQPHSHAGPARQSSHGLVAVSYTHLTLPTTSRV